MSDKRTSIQTRSRAEIQDIVHSKSRSPTFRPSVSRRLTIVSTRIRDRDTDQFDIQECLSSCVVVDVGTFEDGVLATVRGHDTSGSEMVVVVYVSDEDDLPLLVEDFVIAWP